MLPVWLAICGSILTSGAGGASTILDADGAARFALTELRKLSDSGVYESIDLVRVASAEAKVGVYHTNWFLRCVLASEHFKGGAPTIERDVIVMEDLEDGGLSFAIDEFPEMNDDAVEAFWIQKVERERAERERTFAAWEAEAEAAEAASAGAGDGGGDGDGDGVGGAVSDQAEL